MVRVLCGLHNECIFRIQSLHEENKKAGRTNTHFGFVRILLLLYGGLNVCAKHVTNGNFLSYFCRVFSSCVFCCVLLRMYWISRISFFNCCVSLVLFVYIFFFFCFWVPQNHLTTLQCCLFTQISLN